MKWGNLINLCTQYKSSIEHNIELLIIPFSVGRCVIPCAFLVKVSNIYFLVENYILISKKDVYNFPWRFNVTVTSRSDIPVLPYLRLECGVL